MPDICQYWSIYEHSAAQDNQFGLSQPLCKGSQLRGPGSWSIFDTDSQLAYGCYTRDTVFFGGPAKTLTLALQLQSLHSYSHYSYSHVDQVQIDGDGGEHVLLGVDGVLQRKCILLQISHIRQSTGRPLKLTQTNSISEILKVAFKWPNKKCLVSVWYRQYQNMQKISCITIMHYAHCIAQCIMQCI